MLGTARATWKDDPRKGVEEETRQEAESALPSFLFFHSQDGFTHPKTGRAKDKKIRFSIG